MKEFKVCFRENNKKVIQIADSDVLDCAKKSIEWFKEVGFDGCELKRAFEKLDDNFVSTVNKYLCWYLENISGINIDDVEVVLVADLHKFLTEADYAAEMFEENCDILPELGIKFWEIPISQFIDEENAQGFFDEICKIIGD